MRWWRWCSTVVARSNINAPFAKIGSLWREWASYKTFFRPDEDPHPYSFLRVNRVIGYWMTEVL